MGPPHIDDPSGTSAGQWRYLRKVKGPLRFPQDRFDDLLGPAALGCEAPHAGSIDREMAEGGSFLPK
jgi:hypothetical protein